MKKYLLFFALMGLGSHSFAQGNRNLKATSEQRAQHMTDWIDKTVKLSADQKPKVYALNLKYINKMRETKDSAQDDRKAMWKDIQLESQQKDTELKGILSTDQYTAYAAAKKQRIETMRQRRKLR